MGKYKFLGILAALLLLLYGCSSYTTNRETEEARPRPTQVPTESPAPIPEETQVQLERNYWVDGLEVIDVSGSTSRSCSYDMCVFLKLTAIKTCSKITLDGEVFTYDDVSIDEFSEDFGELEKGKSKVVELGTVYMGDGEEYVEYYDYTCWK